ncbi:5184_t:CDS:1 [Ambispora gerdemannii]|uniref:5184_t:CDS:1 n=1 Tax=Ambispora gerdemannii TaxID=144530 RepID=A0A9N9FDY8_9GLOM|nr:5184_t:CDS:1 [Ambispora gerdemannii]
MSKITTTFDFDNVACNIRPSYESEDDHDTHDFSILNPIMKIFKDGNAKWVKDTKLAKDIENWLATHKIAPKYLFELLLDKHGVEPENADVACLLALLYYNGLGAEKSGKKAFKMLKEIAQKGDSFAAIQLGCCYEIGIGTTQDEFEAFYWYSKSAKSDFAGGYWYMAACYEQGVGTKQNYKSAVQYYQKSLDMGCFPAALYLAKCYRSGIGVDQDITKAFYLTLKATRCQFGGAYTETGRYYSCGRATTKDVHKAIRFFHLGIENEDDEAYGQIVKLFYPLIVG